MRTLLIASAVVSLVAVPAMAQSQADKVVLVLKDHRFMPSTIEAPAGQKIRIELINQDGASEEFDSLDLGVEEDVTPHGKISFVVGPLAPGVYAFMGELHPETARGTIKVVAPN